MHRRGRVFRRRFGRFPVRRLRQRGRGHQGFRFADPLQSYRQQYRGESRNIILLYILQDVQILRGVGAILSKIIVKYVVRHV